LNVEGSFQNASQYRNPALTIRTPCPKTKARREEGNGYPGETKNARQRKALTANQIKPQHWGAGRSDGDLTRSTD
jgi:hypothetical protein